MLSSYLGQKSILSSYLDQKSILSSYLGQKNILSSYLGQKSILSCYPGQKSMLSGRMELGAATRIISTERKEVIIDKIKTRCRVVQKLLLELSYWLMLISLGADVDVDLGPRPNQAKLPSLSFYPIHFIHCLNLNGMN